jgi:AcrR family transcriptional regulator
MPRAFSEIERQRIRSELMAAGQRLFAAQGLKKTNVAELTRECGIAKGSFYHFFDSKEVLFMAILEEIETAIKADVSRQLEAADGRPDEVLKAVLLHQFQALEENPMLSVALRREEYLQLLRGLPPERVEQHQKEDEDAVAAIIKRWRDEGIISDISDELINGLIRGVFLLYLHRAEIGAAVFPSVIETLLGLIARYIVNMNPDAGDQR